MLPYGQAIGPPAAAAALATPPTASPARCTTGPHRANRSEEPECHQVAYPCGLFGMQRGRPAEVGSGV